MNTRMHPFFFYALEHYELQSSNEKLRLPIIPFVLSRSLLRFCRTTLLENSCVPHYRQAVMIGRLNALFSA